MQDFQELTIGEYLGILRRRVWYFVVPAVLVSVIACIYAWRQAPFYRSETMIQVINRMAPDEPSPLETPQGRIEFVRQLIRSRTFLESLVQELQTAGAERNTEVSTAVLNAGLTFDVFPPHTFKLGYTGSDPVFTQAVVLKLAERVMALKDNSRKIVVAPEPSVDEELRQAADELATTEEKLRQFNERHLSQLTEEGDTTGFSGLKSQLTSAENDLARTFALREATRRRFEEQRSLRKAMPPPPPRSAPAVRQNQPPAIPSGPAELELRLANRQAALERLSHIDPDRSRIIREIDDLQRKVKELKGLQQQQQQGQVKVEPAEVAADVPDDGPVISMPTGAADSAALDLAEAELKFELAKLDRLVLTKEKKRNELARQLDSVSHASLPVELAEELTLIMEELRQAKDRHTLVTSRIGTDAPAKLDTHVENGSFRIIDPANFPEAPSGPNRFRNGVLGSIAGILLGLGFVVARESLDRTLSDEEKASAVMRLPVLTSVPIVAGQKAGKRFWWRRRRKTYPGLAPLSETLGNPQEVVTAGLEPSAVFSLQGADSRIRAVVLDPGNIAGEQYRLMRTSLALMRKQRDKLHTILVSSAIPNEGKTFAACCLSAILSQESHNRVLLIDAGFRTTSASKMFGLHVNGSAAGLSQVLRGAAQLESSIAACADFPLYVLPASARPALTESFDIPSLEPFIHRCEELFDWVIIDAPPVLASADAKILSSASDVVLLVVRAAKTPAKLVKEAVNRIGEDKICGLVMNGVRQMGQSRYYADYYKYSG